MITMLQHRGTGYFVTCILVSFLITSSIVVAAEEETIKDPQSNAVELNKVSVTGTHIKRVDIEGYSPVLTISRVEIEESGASTLSDFLRYHPLQNGTTFNENIGQSVSTSPGGSPFAMRGLGVDATLVLINGRRVAPYPFAHGGSESFVDLNSIPLGAIDRIEILKDGASAIYGSDAIAGVVNIILRKDYEGTEATLGVGQSGEGDAEEIVLNAITGREVGSGSYTFSFDYYSRGDVGRGDRAFSESADHSNEPGGTDFRSQSDYPATVFNAADLSLLQGNAAYDFNPDITMIPETERFGATLNYSRELTAKMDLFAEFGLTRNTTEAQFTPVNFHHFNYTDLAELGLDLGPRLMGPIPGTHPDNPFPGPLPGDPQPDTYVFWRMTEMGLRDSTTETDTARLVTGLEGLAGDWEWDGAIFYNVSDSEFKENNNVNLNRFITNINNGTLNPFGNAPNPQNVLDDIRATQTRKGKSTIYGIDAKATSEIAELDAGPVSLAVGAGSRHESLKDEFDSLTEQGLIVGKGGTETDDDRDINSIFGEINLPLLDTLELQLAARLENYSDFGSTANPKVALRYQPNSQVLLRTSWGTGFRAPTLNQLNGSLLGNVVVVDTARCNLAGGPFCIPTPYNINVSGNPDLDPEKSEAFYLGGVFEPMKDMAIAIDYWSYKREDMVFQGAQFTIDHEADLPGVITRGTPLFPGDPGPIVLIDDTFRNIAEQKTDGIDVEFKYTHQLPQYGKLSVHAFLTRMLSFETKAFPGESFEDEKGSYHLPEFRNTLTLGWNFLDYNVNLTRNYISDYDSYIDGETVDSFTSYDLQFVYSGIKSSKIIFGIENLTDEEPPFANEEEGFDPAIHNPMGRYYYARYNHKF